MVLRDVGCLCVRKPGFQSEMTCQVTRGACGTGGVGTRARFLPQRPNELRSPRDLPASRQEVPEKHPALFL